MALPLCLRDLNPIVNLWSIIELKACMFARKNPISKDKLWNALADAVNDISMETSKKLISSVDNRLLFVPQNKRGEILKHAPVETIENSFLKT